MTKPHVALLDPDGDDEDIDAFLAALGVGQSARAADEERGVAQDWTKGEHGYFIGSRPKGGAHAAPSPTSPAALEAKAKEVFGTTDDIHEAGYITPDGTMLDFSGRHQAAGYVRVDGKNVPEANAPKKYYPTGWEKKQPPGSEGVDYLAGGRNVDHRDVYELFPEDDVSGIGRDGRMHQLVNSGFIRVISSGGSTSGGPPEGSLGLEIHQPMTSAQLRTVMSAARHYESLGVDVVDQEGTTVAIHDNWQKIGYSNGSVVNDANQSAAGKTPPKRATLEELELFEARFMRGGPQHWSKGAGGLFTGSLPGGALVAPNDMGNFPDAGQASIQGAAQSIADYGEANGTPGFPTMVDELTDETLRVYDRATPQEIAAGEVWYQKAHDQIATDAKTYGYSLEKGCGVTARCSPQRQWTENEPLSQLIMKTTSEDKPFAIDKETFDKLQVKPPRGPGVYKPSELDPRTAAFADPAYKPSWVRHSKEWTSQVGDSITILRANDAEEVPTISRILGGPKIRNFYNNLHDPTDPVSVTIDSLQVRVMTPNGLKLPGAGKKPSGALITSSDVSISYFTARTVNVKGGLPKGIGMYPFFAAGMQNTTRVINARRKKAGLPPLIPQQTQAITWLVQQREGNQGGT